MGEHDGLDAIAEVELLFDRLGGSGRGSRYASGAWRTSGAYLRISICAT
jgi:hypothetical protein